MMGKLNRMGVLVKREIRILKFDFDLLNGGNEHAKAMDIVMCV